MNKIKKKKKRTVRERVVENEKLANYYTYSEDRMTNEEFFWLRWELGMSYLRGKKYTEEEINILKRSKSFWTWLLILYIKHDLQILKDVRDSIKEGGQPMRKFQYYAAHGRLIFDKNIDDVVWNLVWTECQQQQASI